MTIVHHATDETLMRYAAGTLEAGPSIVIEAHLAACARCRESVAAFEAVGGALLESEPPTVLSPSALADVLTRIDNEEEAPPAVEHPPAEIAGVRLPDALRGCAVGRWRWIGPGMRMSRVGVPHDPDANLILLRVGKGRALPEHGHDGTEFTLIVAGSYSDDTGRYGPGDLAEMGADVEHQPVVDSDEDCICLAAIDGSMRFNGFLARMLQPIFGI